MYDAFSIPYEDGLTIEIVIDKKAPSAVVLILQQRVLFYVRV